MKKILLLVPDLDIECVLKSLLPRFPKVLGLPEFDFKIVRHPNRDPGCRNAGVEFLRPFIQLFDYTFIIFDHEGSGKENISREKLEFDLEIQLSKNGWGKRGYVIAIDPEIESWVWIDSPHTFEIMGWKGEGETLRKNLSQLGFVFNDLGKPVRPKEALEKALKGKNKVASSSIHQQICAKASFKQCQDPAFIKLKQTFLALDLN